MNTVHIELNSYTQEVRFFVNGMQTDPYSALTNFTYAQVLQNPQEVLDAVSRELNDNFDLEVTASEWEYKKIEDVAFDFADCNSCAARESVISLTSRQRAEKLGTFLPEQTISVLTSGSFLPQPRTYGTITLRATQDPADATCTTQAQEREVLDAAEALLVNPAIGAAAREAAKQNASYAVCYSLSPVITASFPRSIQADEEAEVIVSSFPEGQAVPAVTVRSSNPDVVFVNGTTLRAVNTGMTNIQVFVQGKNVPFHSQKVRVEKNVCVTRIEVMNLEGALFDFKKQAASLFGSAKKMIQDLSDRTGDAIAKRATPLDAFADLEYHFVGPSGSGMVVLDNDSQEPFLKACSFTASPAHNLRNGQEVIILVSSQNAQSRYPGYTVAETSKTVTVSGLMDVIDS